MAHSRKPENRCFQRIQIMRHLFVLAFVLTLQPMLLSAVVYVPDDHASIQDAIAAAADGDTIVVRPGTYHETIDFTGKALTIESEAGPASTIIDGDQAGTVVTFTSNEGPDSILTGFSITNGIGEVSGWYRYGGGVYCENASPTIANNVIHSNSADCGAGLFVRRAASPIIEKNRIVQNAATSGEGGGIYIDGAGQTCSPLIEGNRIKLNEANSGGGIFSTQSSATVRGNTIVYNSAYGFFGSAGGGICAGGEDVVLEDNIVSVNEAGFGGGIYTFGDATLANNIISYNTAFVSGGGVYCDYGAVTTVVNNTVACNTALEDGGGILCFTSSSTTCANTIFYYDAASEGPEIWIDSYATLDISYSDVADGEDFVHIEASGSLNWGAGMLSSNPLFGEWLSGDLHLTWNSPCKDAGDDSIPSLPALDLEGDPRIALDSVDMGADEYHYHLYYSGNPTPGSTIEIKVVAYPLARVFLYLGSGIHDPPYNTPHGDFWLEYPPLMEVMLGHAPTGGILFHSVTIPTQWNAGENHPLQALVGLWGGAYSQFTNLLVISVE